MLISFQPKRFLLGYRDKSSHGETRVSLESRDAKCYPPAMAKLSTEIARELFLYGPAGGKRITSVKQLAKESGASERAIHEHMPQWKKQSEELAINSRETGLVLSLSTSALASHKSDCEFLRTETDRLKLYLRSLPISDPFYATVSRAMLATEKQWAAMSGVLAALDAAGAALKDTAKAKAKAGAANGETGDEEPEAMGLGFKRRG